MCFEADEIYIDGKIAKHRTKQPQIDFEYNICQYELINFENQILQLKIKVMQNLTFELDQPIKVTKDEYYLIMSELSGYVAGQIKGQDYYIKIMCFLNEVSPILNQIIK